MLLDDKPYTLDRVVRMVLSSGMVIVLILLLQFLSDVLIPFAVAFLLAYLINPLVTFVQKKVNSRGAAVAIALLLVLCALILAGSLLLPVIVNEFVSMGPMLQKIAASKPPEWLTRHLPDIDWNTMMEMATGEDVQQFFRSESFRNMAKNAAQKILPGVWNVITGATSFFFGLIGMAVVVLYMIFLLIDYDKIKDKWIFYLPSNSRTPIADFVTDFNDGMKRYFRGQALIASIVGILFALGFWLIGLPMGILLGLFIGLLNMVPYLQIIGIIPAFILALLYGFALDGSPWRLPVLTLVVFAVVQTLQDTVLTPKIMGKVTGLSPALILLSLAVWGKLLGFLGLLIAIPLTCLALAYYKRFIIRSCHT